MRKILAVTIVCAFALATIVRADEAQQRALAEELLDAMQMQKTIEKSSEMMKQMIPAQMKQMGVSENASLDDAQDLMQKMMDLVMKEMSWEKIKDDYIAVYAETFTEEELSGLVTFYKSPIGRKYTEKQPEIMKRTMQISQKQMIELMPKIEKLTQEILSDKDLKSGKTSTRETASRIKKEIRTVAVALETYYIDHNRYPDKLLQLTTPVAYIEQLPKDPFGPESDNDLRYRADPERKWILQSRGPDGDFDMDLDLYLNSELDNANFQSGPGAKYLYNPEDEIDGNGDIIRVGP